MLGYAIANPTYRAEKPAASGQQAQLAALEKELAELHLRGVAQQVVRVGNVFLPTALMNPYFCCCKWWAKKPAHLTK